MGSWGIKFEKKVKLQIIFSGELWEVNLNEIVKNSARIRSLVPKTI